MEHPVGGIIATQELKVIRCLKPLKFGKISSAQLHQSVDAREDGYGAVTYLLVHDLHKRVHCAFIMGKAWVAPLKSITTIVVMSRMDKLWRKELKMTLQESVFWADSTSVLLFYF